MGDNVISEPLISLSANFQISAYSTTLFRYAQADPYADRFYFSIYSTPNKFIISHDALRVINAREWRHKFAETHKDSVDIESAFADIKKQDNNNELAGKSIEEVVWGPANFCRLTTRSGSSLYIPADFKTLRNAMLLGLEGAHIDININERDLSSTIRTYKPRQSPPKKTHRMK